MRGVATGRRRREVGPLPLVAAAQPAAARTRVRVASARSSSIPPRRLPRTVRNTGESELRSATSQPAATDVVQSALPGSGEDTRTPARRRRQVPASQEVPAAEDHMGRRGDGLLLQGEVEKRSQGVVRTEQVSNAGREEVSGQEDGSDAGSSEQLVQE